MVLVDSHCHLNMLDLRPFDQDVSNVIKRANESGVEHFLCVAVTLSDHAALVQLAEKFESVHISVGLHPNEAPGEGLDLPKLFEQAKHPKVIAIGETGLDYYRSQGDLSWQQERFREQIHAAKQLRKPLIIHTRDAKQDTIDILKAEKADEIGGVMHCFTEDWEMAQKALDLNFYISFSGIVTFKSAKTLQEVAQKVPLDRMLVETDCPYLAPNPHRGKMNQPAYVKHVAEFIAELRGIPVTEVAEQTTQNYFNLFGL